jgi:hypothetical protein
MCKKMQGEVEPKAWEQGFKVCNTLIKTDKMKLSTFLSFLIFFLVFFTLFCYNKNCIQLHHPLRKYNFCETIEQM